jgi:hypothetical protein
MSNTKEQLSNNVPCRMNAKMVLADKIKREKKQTEALEILHDELDWESLTTKQEEVLWSFFIQSR